MADFAYRPSAPMASERWLASRSPIYNNPFYSARFETGSTPSLSQSLSYTPQGPAASTHDLPSNNFAPPGGSGSGLGPLRHTPVDPSSFSPTRASNPRLSQVPPYHATASPAPPGQVAFPLPGSWSWDQHAPRHPGNHQGLGGGQGPGQGGLYQGGYSPSDSMDDLASPSLSDYSLENAIGGPGGPGVLGQPPPGSSSGSTKPRLSSAGPGSKTTRAQRRPSNRDEFDGPHQFLKRPPAELIALQERDLPRLPTHLLVQEQDSVLNQVNDRLSQCAFDFVAKYQFPIPLTQDMRPVERPRDREWTEWVYLLKRLATKRRIPARVLYNGQIKQFVTVLENSLEMRHAAKHQSRPLKDDRNILQLVSAGIQVAKILKDAQAMDYLDRLYVSTEQRIRERVAAVAASAAAANGVARFR
ncbi:hypothetical protein C8A05DRAFT_47510 [Staphylotrichum tortipilum]|uniref:Uncharacterized protein n=1 Tax=Staphylotrichum tortipilum TaxID=2831512 RepID=A0AAN6MCT3_9PEZI|nr:hypothetical protein C8A05DRAFT_47510 [Staphylotrichum longicolle]